MSFFKSKPAKSTQSSLSENINNPAITTAYTPQIGEGTGANNFLSQLLGITPDAGAQAGYNNYLQNAGYAPAMTQLSKNITGQAAAAGMLNSGATKKALQTRGAELNQGFYNNYLQQLAGLSGLGLQAGGLTANTGQKSTSTGTSIGGSPSLFNQFADAIGKTASTVGKVASVFAAPSDRRLKRDISAIGSIGDLTVYTFRYLWDGEGVPLRTGCMADEVGRFYPEALGPRIFGFATVNYPKLLGAL